MTTTTTSLGLTITRTLNRTKDMADALLSGITAEQFARMPVADGKTINTNHPAFVIGHLSIYPKMILEILGVDSVSIQNPPRFDELFMHGVECVDDANGDVYPSMDEIVSHFNNAHETVIKAIQGLDDEALNTAFTGDEWYVEMMGTPGSLCIFMLHSHYMFHLGQLSAWRRCMGLGSVNI